MYKWGLRGLAILALVYAGSAAFPGEPDGRVIFRYDWPKKTDAEPNAPVLRLTMTAVVPLTDAHVAVRLPSGIELTVRAAGRAPAAWPREGLGFGTLAAGQTVVLDLDLVKPSKGGGIIGFALDATAGGRAVHEGVGVPVGTPGTEPVVRDGIVEFPAAREEPAP